jgi:hypothetical protein
MQSGNSMQRVWLTSPTLQLKIARSGGSMRIMRPAKVRQEHGDGAIDRDRLHADNSSQSSGEVRITAARPSRSRFCPCSRGPGPQSLGGAVMVVPGAAHIEVETGRSPLWIMIVAKKGCSEALGDLWREIDGLHALLFSSNRA